ncbi:hypothetical protein F5Y08DRAFT_12846 [Xylaria arbuscula]|nr:hypothetical protein F5Y08DRAFT_12846 [Xylaria arbuscula]
MSTTEQNIDNSEWIWQLDLFGALKRIFQGDLAYGLLADKLGWTLKQDYHRQPGPYPTENRATRMSISVFRNLCISRLGLGSRNSFKVKDALVGDNARFLRVLGCVSSVLDHLVDDGVIDRFRTTDVATLLGRLKPSGSPELQRYQSALCKLVANLRVSVQGLLHRLDTENESIYLPQTSLLLEPNILDISHTFLLSCTSSQIDLLLAVEKMLLAPPCRHLWLEAIDQWCAKLEDSSGASHDELLSVLLPTYRQTGQLLQEFIAIALDDFYEIDVFTLIQKRDFLRCQQHIDQILNALNERTRRENLDKSLLHLKMCVESWDDMNITEFGRLIQADKLQFEMSSGDEIIRKDDEVNKVYRLYLFQEVLVGLEESRYVAPTPKRSSQLKHMIKRTAHRSKPLTLYLNSLSDVSRLCEQEPFQLKFRSHALSGVLNCAISFTDMQQITQWYESLRELTPSTGEVTKAVITGTGAGEVSLDTVRRWEVSEIGPSHGVVE